MFHYETITGFKIIISMSGMEDSDTMISKDTIFIRLFGRPIRVWMIIMSIIIVISVTLMGCQEKIEEAVTIKEGEKYEIVFSAQEGNKLNIEWKASDDIFWQLIDDNSTKVPGLPLNQNGFELEDKRVIQLHQEANYTFSISNLANGDITLSIEWEIS